MDKIDAGAYLTEQLRVLTPGPYEREISRAKRAAHRRGFLLGVAATVAVVISVTIVYVVFVRG